MRHTFVQTAIAILVPEPLTRNPKQPHPQRGRASGVAGRALIRSIPAQMHQLILYMSNNRGYVDEFVQEWTSAKQLYKHFLWDKSGVTERALRALPLESNLHPPIPKRKPQTPAAHTEPFTSGEFPKVNS